MVSTTFLNLKDDKRQRIMRALLTEFSHYPLPQAQVARIVEQAQIARGSFYKYFTDLIDAYVYVLRKALVQIHSNLSEELKLTSQDSLMDFCNYTSSFALQLKKSPCREFYRLFWQENQYYLQTQGIKLPTEFQSLQQVPLRINNHLLKNRHQNQVLIELLHEIGHATIKKILNGQNPTQVLQDMQLVVKIIRAGLRYEEEI
ncbi:TetR/AcrR family transcriptional regulator [Bombilactobacillus bombi]|uniref:TetR/AcrR family transcriptional regulator n=1 Tax=Bombilactobacillus bombi TaxID=1303590 RepID=UPI0015E59D59|nr:TetR/AcrR family transcriptional regulator [Bombilactobacillus bombi]MBA1434384.1 TetR/AcrR family transcriptional regulator [Bombilactobacillus bombi]